MRGTTITLPEHTWHVVPIGGATRRGDVYEAGLRMPPLREALSLLHRRSF